MGRYNIILLLAALWMVACNGEIYVRDGVTDGDTFFLSPEGMTTGDPVVQSWVSYSLGLSACQLQSDTDNPARSSSFDCELRARRLLLDSWQDRQRNSVGLEDPYLDKLEAVRRAGYLREYVAHYLSRNHWHVPDDLRRDEFKVWNAKHLPRHEAQTRLTGSWAYARPVMEAGN